jgi:glycosyltransferase involved in cell wall biosynthesis
MATIAFATTQGSIKWGGSEHLWVDVAARLISEGHQVTVCVRKWPQLDSHIAALRDAGATVNTWPQPTLIRRALRKFGVDRSAMRLGHYDVLVVNCGGTTDLLGNKPLQVSLTAAYRQQKPYVVAIHSNGEHYLPYSHRLMLRRFIGGSAAVVLPATRMRSEVERVIAVELPQSVTLPTPTPLSAAEPPPFPASDTLRMATVGRLYVTQKGQDLLFAALARVSWRDKPWTLDVFGSGGDDQYLRDLAAMYGLDDRISFGGHVDDVRSVWEKNQVLLMPSRMEARGIAITEAMACARPVVGSAIGGIPDTIDDGETGILARSATVDGWVEALERLWLERESLAVWGSNGRQLLDEVFAVDVVQEMADLIVRAATGASPPVVDSAPLISGQSPSTQDHLTLHRP